MNHGLEMLGVAFDGQYDGAFFDAVGGGGDSGDDLAAIGEAEAHRKSSVGAELDRLALESDLGVGFGGAVDDQLGIKLKPELAGFAVLKCAGAKAGDGGAAHGPAQALLEELFELETAGGGIEPSGHGVDA